MGRLKRYWDFATSSRLKYYLCLIWFACWIVPALVHIFLKHSGLVLYYGEEETLAYYIYMCKNLPLSLDDYLLNLWNTTDIISIMGMILSGVVIFLLSADLLLNTKEYPPEVNLDADSLP